MPTGPLLNDIQAARDAVAQMEQRLARIEARLPELVVEVGTLARKSGNAATNGGTP